MNTLGDRLKSARESKKLGQKDVEKITGISFKTLSNYENNRSEPDVEKLSLLCKAYAMPADYFINSNYETEHAPNFFLHLHEQELIKKYRALDEHGKDVTDYILNAEYTRGTSATDKQIDLTPGREITLEELESMTPEELYAVSLPAPPMKKEEDIG